MKTLMLSLFLLTTSVFAKDSLWVLCKSNNLVMNILEHRDGADGRVAEVTLIYGSHVAKGTLDYELGKMANFKGKSINFDGEISFRFPISDIKIQGNLRINNSAYNIKQVLACEEIPNTEDL